MAEVYYIEHFRNNCKTYKEHFKEAIEEILSTEDNKDFLDALTDFDLYEQLDEDIKTFVQFYYNENVPICMLGEFNAKYITK